MSARTRFTFEETIITMALFMGAVYLYYIVSAWGISDHLYQYVGDEVVLTWPSRDRASGKRCLETYFAFHTKLQKQRSWYEAQFGIEPLFRGSVDTGPVTATEVGDIKREIAFHGDTLNRAARLLELCKELGRDLLVSGYLHKSILDLPDFDTELQGEVTLRGKAEKISVYAVSLASRCPLST